MTLAGGGLLYETVVGGMPEQLIALSDSEFMLGNQVRVAFERDAKGGMRIRARLPDGGTTTFARVSAGNSPG